MARNVHFALAMVVMFLGCFAVEAQTRGGNSPAISVRVAPTSAVIPSRGSSPSTAPVPSGAQASRQVTGIQILPSGRSIFGADLLTNPRNFSDGSAVPGLGFDYVHLAAVSGNFRGNPPVFGRGARHHRNFMTPVFFGGFPYYFDSPDYQQEQQQPQVIVIQQPVPAVTIEQPLRSAQETTPEAAQPAPSPVPVREVGEFILVRRDGRILFASVFSVTGTQVHYVTPEGIRRALPLAELDTVATQEMNEARGTTLQFNN